MNELEKLLINSKLQSNLKELLKTDVKYFYVNNCFFAVRNFEKNMNNLSSEAKEIYRKEFKDIIDMAKWVALSRLSKDEVVKLFKEKLLVLLKFDQIDIFLPDWLRSFLLGIISLDERDELKLAVRNSLMNNEELLGGKTIKIWIKEIISEAGRFLEENIKETQFYINNRDFISLEDKQKNLIKQIVKTYKYCSFSSNTPEGLDEPIFIVDDRGKYIMIEHGQIIELPPLDKDLREFLNDYRRQLIGKKVSNKTVRVAESKINIYSLKKILDSNLLDLQKKYNINQGLKKMQNLSLGELIKKIEEKPTDAKIVLSALSLLSSHDKTFSQFRKSQIVQKLIDPNLKKIDIKELFKKILSTAGLTEQESALFVMYLAKINDKFIGMSYLDIKTSKFKWK